MERTKHSTSLSTSPASLTSAWTLIATVAALEAIGFSTIWTFSPTPATGLLLLALGLPWLTVTICLGTIVLPRLRDVAAAPAPASARSIPTQRARTWRLAIEITAALALISVGLFAQILDASDEPAATIGDGAPEESTTADGPAATSDAASFRIMSPTGMASEPSL